MLNKKEDLFITIFDLTENAEIFSTKESTEKFSEISSNLPFNFNINVYVSNKLEYINLALYLKDRSKIENSDDIIIGNINFKFDAKQNFLSISDKYILEVTKKNYFKVALKDKDEQYCFLKHHNIDDGSIQKRIVLK